MRWIVLEDFKEDLNNRNKKSFLRIFKRIKNAKKGIEKSDTIRVVSHYDTDGIASASLLLYTFLKLGKEVHLSIVKQIREKLMNKLIEENPSCVLFSDLGSGYLEGLGKLEGRVIILDHHKIKGELNKEDGYHINPLLDGIGEDEICGSGLAYLFSRAFLRDNKKLAYLPVIGAIGDIQEEKWVMKGLNKEILKEAISEGCLKREKGIRLFGRMNRPIHKALVYSTDPYIPGITGDESSAVQFLSELQIEVKENDKFKTLNDLEDEELKRLASAIIRERIREEEKDPEEIFGDIYTLKNFPDNFKDAREFSTLLNASGRMGKASRGILACLGNEEALEDLEGISRGYRKMLGKYLSIVKKGNVVEESPNVYYIRGEEKIHENFIGPVIGISGSSFLKNKPIIGFSNSTDEEIKISGRIKQDKETVDLAKIFGMIVEECGGRSGGHKNAAGAYIRKDRINEFIERCENYFEEVNKEK